MCDCHCFCFCRVEAYPQVAVSSKVVMVVPGWGVCCVVLGLVDTPVLRDKRGFSLVHCWVSGAALVVPVGPCVHGCSVCGWLCVGLCCVRTV